MSTIRVTLYEDEEVLVECDYLFNKTKVAMHISFNEDVWSHSFFKRMVYIYVDILNNFKLDHNDPNYPTIDHKISVYYGFKNSIDPNIIGSIDNLCITKRSINSSKRHLIEEEFINYQKPE